MKSIANDRFHTFFDVRNFLLKGRSKHNHRARAEEYVISDDRHFTVMIITGMIGNTGIDCHAPQIS